MDDALTGRASRRFVAVALEAWRRGALVADAELIVSELVGNTAQHTDSEHVWVTLAIENAADADVQGGPGDSDAPRHGRPRAAALYGAVGDTSASRPRESEPPPDCEGGRGMNIISALAATWGAHSTDDGKEVWFRLSDVSTADGPGTTSTSESESQSESESPSESDSA